MSALLTRSIAAYLAVVLPAAAHADCWRTETVRAAMVRDLDTMLMVGALRCRAHPDAYHDRYNAFVDQSRTALAQANEHLRNHFRRSVGYRAAVEAYDVYTTKVANRYGAGAEGLGCSDLASVVAAMAAEKPHYEALAALAERAKIDALIDGEPCDALVIAAPTVAETMSPVRDGQSFDDLNEDNIKTSLYLP